MPEGRLRRYLSGSRTVLGAALLLLVVAVLLWLLACAFGRYPAAPQPSRKILLGELCGLEWSLKAEGAARKMQDVFPEGGCFLHTLYGLAWANCARRDPQDDAIQGRALEELRWALDQYENEEVVRLFHDTQVRRGVFWLGQRNLLLGRALEVMPQEQRPAALVEEFHQNSRELAAAFLASPTHHLESYTGQCYPADNATALASLLVHDRLYQTDTGAAYRAWKAWTLAHADPATGLPAGQVSFATGALVQRARGCANSWIIAVLGELDPEFTREMHEKYRRHFAVRRLGFLMFREYPPGHVGVADIDSGPIIWDAGVAATGIGLAAARAAGDEAMAGDIHCLAGLLGVPFTTKKGGDAARRHLFGVFPIGDAFLAWGYSQPAPERPLYPAPGFVRLVGARWPFIFCWLVVCGLLGLREYFFFRGRWRRRKSIAQDPDQRNHENDQDHDYDYDDEHEHEHEEEKIPKV